MREGYELGTELAPLLILSSLLFSQGIGWGGITPLPPPPLLATPLIITGGEGWC